MRVGLNLLPVRPGIGGSWNYIHALISALARHDRENEYVVFVTPASAAMVPSQPNFRTVELAIPTAWRPIRVLFENTLLRFPVRKERLDCLHHVFGTLPFGGSMARVVTVYDLMEFERPSDVRLAKRVFLHAMRRRTAARATMLAPISQTTANDLHSRLGVSSGRMEVVPTCIEPHFVKQPEEMVARFRTDHGLPDQFWLAVADHMPHKNFDRMVPAFARLRRKDPSGWKLVFRSEPSSSLLRLIDEHQIGAFVSFIPRLEPHEMPLLYSAASALIFPSLFEGGGIPVLEAMACSCPVVASNISTTIEFAGNAAFIFDPLDIEAITLAMHQCETSPDARARHIERGVAKMPSFDSRVVAHACMNAYRAARAMHAGRH
jgi:glycosyltransferase involved in cell wall biosynthesis